MKHGFVPWLWFDLLLMTYTVPLKIPPNLRHVLALNFSPGGTPSARRIFSRPVCYQTQAANVMPIVQTRLNPLDKLWVLWAICLVKHYQDNQIPTSPKQIRSEFGMDTERLFYIALEMADYYKLIDLAYMQLTPKGLVACQQWESISRKIYAV